jgi:hypothetical protein
MKTPDPQAESARLTAYYAQLPEGELLELGQQYETLTAPAQAAIRAEFDRRALPAPELSTPPDEPQFQSLVTIRQYRDPPQATLAAAALDSAGIFCFLENANFVRLDWALSNLVGGIRLQVRPEDQAAAEAILSQPIPPAFETDEASFDQPRCPACQSLDISMLWAPSSWTCASCGAKWEDLPDPAP